MKTTFRIRQPYCDLFLNCAREFICNSSTKPRRFIDKMKMNRGIIAALSGLGVDADGLERKNPVIVALGDSVTAGHFESLLPVSEAQYQEALKKILQNAAAEIPNPPIEITDARECYLEKFRSKLIDWFETTSVSIINNGIAGDDLIQMAARAERDVIRYQPDLILINGALNWDDSLGKTSDYEQVLRGLVKKLKAETEADIILITPNGSLPDLTNQTKCHISTLVERVGVIRNVALQEAVGLADVFAVWEAVREKGCPWDELLANGVSHPSVEGHEVYAIILMKLLEDN